MFLLTAQALKIKSIIGHLLPNLLLAYNISHGEFSLSKEGNLTHAMKILQCKHNLCSIEPDKFGTKVIKNEITMHLSMNPN
jgi:hypothetical protein